MTRRRPVFTLATAPPGTFDEVEQAIAQSAERSPQREPLYGPWPATPEEFRADCDGILDLIDEAASRRHDRKAVVRFLRHETRPRDRWPDSLSRAPKAWCDLRRGLDGSAIGPDAALREFLALLLLARRWRDDEKIHAERVERARKALPSRRQRKRIEESSFPRQGVGIVFEIPGDEWSALVIPSDAQRDEQGRSRLRPGSGRPASFDSSTDALMRFLVSLRLTERAAERVATDALRWFSGIQYGEGTIRTSRQRRRLK